MDSITEFLESRIADDEAAADSLSVDGGQATNGGAVLPAVQFDDGHYWPARWNPVRALAECAAKRAIIDQHEVVQAKYLQDYCSTCADWANSEVGEGPPGVEWPCPTIRALAAVYADHRDYQQEWARG